MGDAVFFGGKWVTPAEYARHYGLLAQTLANQRHKDLKEGRSVARDGYPLYRRFGRSIRYWLPVNDAQAAA